MNQITITVDMTPENLEILKQLCPVGANKEPTNTEAKKTVKKTTDKPVPVEETAGTWTPGGGSDEHAETTQDVKDKPEEPAPWDEPEETAAKDKPSVSLTDVRAVALTLSKAGKQDALKAAFAKFGGKKLSDIKPEDYGALMKELTSEVTENA